MNYDDKLTCGEMLDADTLMPEAAAAEYARRYGWSEEKKDQAESCMTIYMAIAGFCEMLVAGWVITRPLKVARKIRKRKSRR